MLFKKTHTKTEIKPSVVYKIFAIHLNWSLQQQMIDMYNNVEWIHVYIIDEYIDE